MTKGKQMEDLTKEALIKLVNDRELMEIGLEAVENTLVEWRDSRISEPLRGNGVVIREKCGTPSSTIRFGVETAIDIALRAIASELAKGDDR